MSPDPRPALSSRVLLLATAALLGAVISSGCSSNGEAAERGSLSSGEPRGELVVFAAASLTDVFTELAADFEARHPGVRVKLNFAGSQSLRTQIENGAQPQVFASANSQHMEALAEAHLVQEPTTFAHNELVVVVPATNPAGIDSLENLPRANRLVLAGRSVPAGAYAERMLANATSALGSDFRKRVQKKVVSRETHVRQTMQKVILGEADAALVYATDAASAGTKVKTITIPSELNVKADYPIAALADAPRTQLGELFVEFVRSDAGRRALRSHGFRPAGELARSR